jgi:RNA polymerase sigma factor (sigma-70 family)
MWEPGGVPREPRHFDVSVWRGDAVITTNTALLVGLREPRNETVWREFSDRYGPLLISFGIRLGLSRHEAEDAAQETLLAFVTSYRQGRYDRAKGRLRSWLSGIAVNKIQDVKRRREKEVAIGDGSRTTGFLEQFPDPHSITQIWETEWQQAVIKTCMDKVSGQVEPTTMRAFELFALKEWAADEVASHLGISRNAVYKAKNHVLSRMRSMQKDLEDIW